MSRADRSLWYLPGDIPTTIKNSEQTTGVTRQDLIDVLATQELEAPRDRIHDLVESAVERIPSQDDDSTDTPEETRPLEPRFADVSDMRHLNSDDSATVLGVVLSRYEGTFWTPEEVDDLVVDLFWNRQYTTVGLSVISRPRTAPVSEDAVRAVVTGDTNPPTGRSASVLGIVSHAGFTERAREVADSNDIQLFGEEYLIRWLSDAMLTQETFGALIGHDDLSDEEIDELVSQLPPLPPALRETDPLADISSEVWSGADNGAPVQTDVKQPMPIAETPPRSGKKGTLYANPSDDGDFGAFDRYMDELAENDQ